MRSTSIRRPAKVRRTLLGGLVLLMVFALSGIGFYESSVAGSTKAVATLASATTPQSGGDVAPNVRTFTGPGVTMSAGVGAPASPYPSTIPVAVSTSATITKLTVTITTFTHDEPNDVDMLLVGPTGARIVFWSDVGGTNTATGITITVDDAAAASIPAPLATGTFRPTAITTGDSFAAPAPCAGACGVGDEAQPSGAATFASKFNGTNANGTWSLYVVDDAGGDGGSIASWSLNLTFGPTLARMSGGSAIVDDAGLVELKWQTGLEVDNLGFNIYREEGGQRTRVNKNIIAGSALIAGHGTAMTAGRNYRWRDTTATPAQSAQYWIEAKDINGSSVLSGPFSPTYSPGRLEPRPPSSTLGDLGRGRSGKFNLASALVEPAPPGQTAFKVGVKESGYYRVNQSDLVTAGFSSGIDPRNLQLFEDGTQRPILVQGEQDGKLDPSDWIEFYGRAVDSPYSDTHVYQLVAGSEPGLRIKRAKGKGKTAASESFLFTTELKERSIYFPGFSNGGQEKFFGAVVAREPVERTLRLQHVDSEASSPATLEVGLQGVSAGAHNVKVRLNGADVGSVAFEGKSSRVARIDVAQSSLREGDNAIQLIAEGGDGDVSLMGALRMSYWHRYAADGDSLQFTAAGTERVKITGFSGSAIRVLDLTDEETGGVREVNGTVSLEGNGFSITVNVPGVGARKLLAFGSGQVRNPASIEADIPSEWRKRGNKADLVIFTHKDFVPALDALKAHRESQGYRVAVVIVDDVYDEFSYGNKTPQAIKDFLLNAVSRWKGAPRFALFAGDSSYDPKNYLGAGAFDIVPTKLIETKLLETSSDDWFGDFNGDGSPEIAVGRLPIRTAAELSSVVAKIIRYDSEAESGSMLLVADSDEAFDFEGVSTALRGLIPANLSTNEIDRRVTDGATARMQLLNYLNAGQRVVNYFGHGSVDIWRDNLLTVDDAVSLSNGARLSLFVSMTCLNGYFHDPMVDSLGEAMLKSRNGGAVASWASSGLCDLAEQATMNREFYRLLFGGALTVGETAMHAKSSVQDMDVRRTWVLLGDPTTRLK